MDSAYQHITLELQKDVAYLTLNRPQAGNALHAALIQELHQALTSIEQKKTCRVLVLQGAGKHFCAGADLQWMQDSLEDSLQLAHLLYTLDTLSKPTIALLHGAVYGGGIGLTACCDIVLAEPNTQFCFSEVKLGLIPAVISPYAVRAIGSRMARKLFLTAEKFDGEAAKTYGLVHEIITKDNMNERLNVLMQSLLANEPTALKAAKLLIRDVAHQAIDEHLLQDTAARLTNIRATPECQARLKAFLYDK